MKKNFSLIKTNNRFTENGYRVFKKTYYVDFNDGFGDRKVYEIEYTFNKYGFCCHKTYVALNYTQLKGTDYMILLNQSVINIHIGSYTKEVTKDIDCFIF